MTSSDPSDFGPKDLFVLQGQRLAEQAQQIHELDKNIAVLAQTIKDLDERINKGISPTQQKILDKLGAIDLLSTELRYKFECALVEIRNEVNGKIKDIISESRVDKTAIDMEMEEHRGFFSEYKRVLFWGVIGSLAFAASMFFFKTMFSQLSEIRQDVQGIRTHSAPTKIKGAKRK